MGFSVLTGCARRRIETFIITQACTAMAPLLRQVHSGKQTLRDNPLHDSALLFRLHAWPMSSSLAPTQSARSAGCALTYCGLLCYLAPLWPGTLRDGLARSVAPSYFLRVSIISFATASTPADRCKSFASIPTSVAIAYGRPVSHAARSPVLLASLSANTYLVPHISSAT